MDSTRRKVFAAAGRVPGAHPVLGHLPQLREQAREFLVGLAQYGKVAVIRVGLDPVVIVNDRDLAHEVLVGGAGNYVKGVQFEKAARFFGHGLATHPGGPGHLRQRRLLQPAFRHERLQEYSTSMLRIIEEENGSWRDGQRIRVYEQMYGLTLAVLGNTLFSTPLGEDAARELTRSMPVIISGTQRRILSFLPTMGWIPTTENIRFARARVRLRTACTEVIEEYRHDGVDRQDILSTLLFGSDGDTGHHFTDAEVYDQIMTLVVGATETTAVTLSWAFFLLANHPGVEARLHRELDQVLAGRLPRPGDLARLPFLTQVLTETLRLFPSLLVITRRSAASVDLAGMRLPAGTSVWVNSCAIHHDPSVYPEPQVFDPARWAPDRREAVPRNAYLPFGAGNRKCIGDNFAVLEASLALATLASSWQITPPARHGDVRYSAGTTTVPMNLPMTLTRRTRTTP
ncbi:cytochrome P450 [Streptomyces sp. NPDC051577]|uniref:cytochrome P450 n=1 Tax=Streptomyces sp. NPDC051577 TaxID=3155166 RepID=UPI003437D1FE